MDDPAKQLALSAARAARDWGNTILAIGIFVEIAVEAFWLERTPPEILRGTRPTPPFKKWHLPLLTLQGTALLITRIVVLVGLYRERTKGAQADQIVDEMRAGQQQEIVDAETRAADANERAARAIEENSRPRITMAPPHLIMDENDQNFLNLRKFADTPFIVEPLPLSSFQPTNNEALNDLEDQRLRESMNGARSFHALTFDRWKELPAGTIPASAWMPVGDDVMIYSAAPDSFDAWRSDESSPYDLPLNTPKDRAWAAAEALTRYVNSRGYSETATHSSDPNGPLSRLPLPPDTVLITVGPRNPADFENLERDEEMPCPVPLRSNTHRAPAVQGRHARKLGHYRLTASPFAVDPPPNLPLIRGRDWKRSQGGNCGARDYSCKTDSVDRMDRWRKLM